MCIGDHVGRTCAGHQASQAAAPIRRRRSFALQIDGLLFEGGA